MKQEKLLIVVAILSLIVLPACVKTYKLAPSESPQGKEHKDQREVVKNNLRSARVYNQWETEALFDVLWMSPQTQEAYTKTYCMRRGKSVDAQQDMFNKEVAKANDKQTFYVLADIRDQFKPDLSTKDPAWTMYLTLHNGQRVGPKTIKEQELAPEIYEIFGHRFSKPKYKTAYEVTFPACDLTGPFKMTISSTTRQCELGWKGAHPVSVKKKTECTKKRKPIKDEDYYWL